MGKQFKIAIVAACPFPYPRGTPIRIMRMAEGLAAHGHDVHVVTYHLGDKVEDLPFQIHRIPHIPTYRKLSPGPTYQKLFLLDTLLSIKLFRLLSNSNFDVIHAHHFEGLLAGLPVARMLGIPIVFDVHTLLRSELPHYSVVLPKGLMQWLGNLCDHLLPYRADHIVAVTEAIRNRLISEIQICPDVVTTVYGGVEADHFSLPPLSELGSSTQTLIYTGNLAPYQGIDLMLLAFRLILDRRPNTFLKIITSSSHEHYSRIISDLNIQNNLVFENADYFQIPEHLHSATIALHPRVYCDGLPLKLLNYMATGRPIVSFAGSAEALEHEHTGLIVDDHDVGGFANAVLRLLDTPQFAQELGVNAQARVQEFFVWEKSIERIEHIYNGLVEPRL